MPAAWPRPRRCRPPPDAAPLPSAQASKDRAMSSTDQPPHDSHATGEAGSGEFLTFVLGEEEYGVDILRVQEIRSYDAVTRLPDAPDYIKGVINLRGIIVPV